LLPVPQAAATPTPDPVLQTVNGPLVNVTPGIGFDGVGANGVAPSDANLDVSSQYIVQTVNTEWAVYDKSGNIFAGFPKTLGSIWNSLGAPCNGEWGDVVVQYDTSADRWFISQLGSFTAPFFECIAVSTTGDPTGSYALYQYSFGSNLPDYPKHGVWPTAANPAFLATYNLFANGQTFVGADACAYDRTAMLAASPSPSQICFTVASEGSFLPSDMEGPTPPPAGSPGYFVTFETSPTALHLFKLSPNFASPSSSAFSGPTSIPVAAFTEACNGGTCIPQSGTRQKLDSLGDRLMYRLAYRNFGDHEALVTNHSVTAGSSVGVRWYEVRDPNGAANLFQQGTFAPDAAFRWMGSIGTDKVGNFGMGYSISSTSIHPGINYTGREVGDPAGTMQSEAIMLTGGGSQTAGLSRWGDYSAIQIDPSDDCTFWYTTQYLKTNGTFNWSTHIGSFAFNSCTGGGGTPDFTIAATPPSETVSKGGTATYTVTIAPLDGFSGTVSFGVAGLPASDKGTFSPTTVTGSGSTTLTVKATRIGGTGSFPLTITGTSGSLNHTASVILVVQ
jgi:hypothetical protein